MRTCLTAILLVMATGVAVAGSLEEAKTANDKGDFHTAVRIYTELSNQGDRTAQLQLGLMYDEGHGVPETLSTSSAMVHCRRISRRS